VVFAGEQAAAVRRGQRRLEPVYFQEVDCVGLPTFMKPAECEMIVALAEAQGFSRHRRHNMLLLSLMDIVDPLFTRALWIDTGLARFMKPMRVDGMVPCGLNDVVRIQKYEKGDLFGKHTDQEVRRADGRVSKYSLRVFLNAIDTEEEAGGFTGGLSAFHLRDGERPVRLEPETGLGLLYPQGDLCSVQEETEVLSGCKYVLRTDVLFCRPDAGSLPA